MRDGEALSLMGVAASLPDSISPLQIGTTGRHESRPFELIGCVRWQWSDAGLVMGGWTEWLALFADGSHGWLAEAMARYMLTRRIEPLPGDPVVAAVAAGDAVVPGEEVMLAGRRYTVTDARAATAVGSAGELPFAAPKGETLFGVDLVDSAGGCASIQRHEGVTTAYAGRAVTLAGLELRGLRAIEGWTAPAWAL